MNLFIRLMVIGVAVLALGTAYAFYLVDDREQDKLLSVARTTAINSPQDLAGDAKRGEYVAVMAGCAECHSPRDLLGGLSQRALTGNERGPEGESVPGISTADLSDWTVEDLELFLEVGMTPSGDSTGGHMADVIEFSTRLLTANDRTAIANYLLSEENQP